MELLEFNLTSIVMLLQFILLAFVLYKLLYKPYLNMTAKRQNQIKEELEKADEIKAQAHEMREKANKELEEAKQQSEKIIENAHKSADRYSREEKEKAKDQAERMISSASEEIDNMKKEARESLKRETVNLAVLMASKILEKQLDQQTQREYLSGMIEEAGEGDES